MRNKKQAFTLVELIVVIVILAILSTIAFLSFNSYSSSSRDTVRVTDINSLKKSMELFSIKAGTYPTPDNGVNITYSGGTIWTQGILGDKSTKLISTISKKPTDPLSSKEYTYSLLSNKREFQIAADFENPVSYRDNMKMNGSFLASNFSQLSNPYIQQVSASSTGTVCYINGNFNGLVAKASTGVINVILAVPSLIVVDTTNTGNLVYDSNFGSGKLQCNGANSPCNINFNSSNVVFSGSPSTPTEINTMMTNLKTAYSLSNIKTIPAIQNILVASGTALTDLGSGLVKNSLGVTKISPTYSCNTIQPTCSPTSCTITTGTPTGANQTWTQTGNTSIGCTYVCINWYSGTDCSVVPGTIYNIISCPIGKTIQEGTATKAAMLLNIENYTGCKIQGYNGEDSYIAGKTNNNNDILLASANDSATGVWGCYGTAVGLTSQSDQDGKANTLAIVNHSCSNNNTMAEVCYNKGTGHIWYLPSLNELYTLYSELKVNNIGIFSNNVYWSSTEIGSYDSYEIGFDDGAGDNGTNKNFNFTTRCVSRL